MQYKVAETLASEKGITKVQNRQLAKLWFVLILNMTYEGEKVPRESSF